MSEQTRKTEPTKSRVVMSRVSTREQHSDRSFDIEFWQKVGAAERLAAAWQMVKEVQRIRGKSGELPRMQKSISRIIRRSEAAQSDDPAKEVHDFPPQSHPGPSDN